MREIVCARTVSGGESSPKCMAIAEKTEGFGGLVIDIERDVSAIKRSDEAIAFGGFDEMVAVVDHIAKHR